MSPMHIPDVYELVMQTVNITILTEDVFCYILDPVDAVTKQNKLGYRVLIKGPIAFFLQPGEKLDGGI
jgi:hypothetical protein